MGYNHAPGAAGNELVPDLAAGMPEVSERRPDVHVHAQGRHQVRPAVNRAITSADVEYAFERIGDAGARRPVRVLLQGVIEGFGVRRRRRSPRRRRRRAISGIETPDDQTIVFHLTKPTGDFLYRLAMPAAGPDPQEVAKCFTKAGEYGRYVVSTGPYMFEGSDKVDISCCDAMKPSAASTRAVAEPRPQPELRPGDGPRRHGRTSPTGSSYLNTNTDDIFNRIEAGEHDARSRATRRRSCASTRPDPSLQDLHQIHSGDRTWYITMNLTQPPFDDIHVRKAANW